MRELEIIGGRPLYGKIDIQGSKNAALPILAACMIGEGICVIDNCPKIRDVEDTITIMRRLGCNVSQCGNQITIETPHIIGMKIDGKEAKRIRSSILFLGALLGRIKKVILPLPGGCAIGARPIDIHICAMRSLGAQVFVGRNLTASVDSVSGGVIRLAYPSVGATENIILFSVQAEKDTIILNAAREPEIDELCRFLNSRGACICRQSDGSIRVQGGHHLTGTSFCLSPDRIVTGTYMLAAAGTGGEVTFHHVHPQEVEALIVILRRMGAVVRTDLDSVTIKSTSLCSPGIIDTSPYPGFPTDLQSPLMSVLCRVNGYSQIRERVFDERFQTAEELKKMGADIRTDNGCATIWGVSELKGAMVYAPDLRGGAALVIAALQAKGKTSIYRTEYISRGYEDICRDLRILGAQIRQK